MVKKLKKKKKEKQTIVKNWGSQFAGTMYNQPEDSYLSEIERKLYSILYFYLDSEVEVHFVNENTGELEKLSGKLAKRGLIKGKKSTLHIVKNGKISLIFEGGFIRRIEKVVLASNSKVIYEKTH